MRTFLKNFLVPLIASILATTMLGMIFSTQRVISMLNDIGGDVSFSERVSMTGFDLIRFGSLFIIFVAIALTIALTLALFLSRKLPSLRRWIFIVAGMVAIFLMLSLMKKAFFDVQIVAGARDSLGFFLQVIAGGLGGYVFYRLNERQKQIQLSEPTAEV